MSRHEAKVPVGGRAAPGAGRDRSGGDRRGRRQTGASAAATTAGCGKAPGPASGTQTIQSGGKNRTFILRVPGDYDNTRPYRLIFAFHWWGGTANEVASGGTSGAPWAYYGQQELSDNNAIMVANASVSLDFQASHTGDTAKPTYFTLNGAVCATA